MFERYNVETPITRGNALFLAKKIGTEHPEGNRTVFNLLAVQLFERYSETIKQPIDNNWRRLPLISELKSAAVEGLMTVIEDAADPRVKRLQYFIEQGARVTFAKAVPRMASVINTSAIPADSLQEIVGALMQARQDAVVETGRQKKGVVFGFVNYLADSRAEALHKSYLADVSNADLMDAYALAADNLRKQALNGGIDEHDGYYAADHLVAEARSLGGSKRQSTWASLSTTQTFVETYQTNERLRMLR